jgi:hypothetical protein
MCLLCAAASADRDLARRSHVLHLLALVEHPDALPADAALRLAQEILMMTRPGAVTCRCEAVAPPEVDDEAGTDRRPP